MDRSPVPKLKLVKLSTQLASIAASVAYDLQSDPKPYQPLGFVTHEQIPCGICFIPVSRLEASDIAKRTLARLTPRQTAILDQMVAGHSAKVIAFNLKVSQRTVENHIQRIYKKTGTHKLPALLSLVFTPLDRELG